ncbi:hypothetical protein OMR07_00715 [Methylobacterium organophilum]|nr:hypothetical protein [Methylobacterium organophilum]
MPEAKPPSPSASNHSISSPGRGIASAIPVSRFVRAPFGVRRHTQIWRAAGTQDHGAIIAPRRTPMFDPARALPPVVGAIAAVLSLMIVVFA